MLFFVASFSSKSEVESENNKQSDQWNQRPYFFIVA